MSDTVIRVENVSKKYTLGEIGSNYLSKDIGRLIDNFYKRLKKEESETSELWALKNINFTVEQGEILGLIGSNGAGKSTLLKILSRVTAPSSGVLKLKGRVSSLLEVGTGFHGELTGRENIYLNGAILGMRKHEIRKRFDDIVDFSGVDKFIDTPVKRYSSGMYVRLAFAVGAYLESDILIIDEVLAVGDAEFQQKCLGRMKDLSSGQGRTVLFVSHNMQAVASLCTRAIWMDHGTVKKVGDPRNLINSYLADKKQMKLKQEWSREDAPGNEYIRVLSVELKPAVASDYDLIDVTTPFTVEFSFENLSGADSINVDLLLFTLSGECIFDIYSKPVQLNSTLIKGACQIPGNFLNNGTFYFSLYFGKDVTQELFFLDNCIQFEVEDKRDVSTGFNKWMGYIRPDFPLVLSEQE
ncbi:ABC transporter ATP-binding protein [Flavihumibacter sp. ZG627]|uniref:ABC transporter ATP-binding protein n=1 Tax=Flavihumibacter sp. ZG627 TaxID=1463156 RepID=UPI00057D3A9F|nr:ABC transporter ATP-binding protein [Flavihumibacter sp. ZG627]KIC92329.1 ABC transporter [Flavihumibacter sp. ZG627]